MRSESVPERPATGSDEMSSSRTPGSSHITVSKDTSAVDVIRSSSDSPDPSTTRTPSSGTPACSSSPVTTPAPAAVVPREP